MGFERKSAEENAAEAFGRESSVLRVTPRTDSPSDSLSEEGLWSLTDLSKCERNSGSFSCGAKFAEVSIGEEEAVEETATQTEDRKKISVPQRDKSDSRKLYKQYRIEGNALVSDVSVFVQKDGFVRYGQFVKDGERYFVETAAPCEYVPFLSFLPQYSQMNEQQRRYYFFFRDRVRQHFEAPLDDVAVENVPKTDRGYLLLLIFEILNFSHILPPKKGLRMLCFLLKAYLPRFPQLASSVAVWVTDYCLVHYPEVDFADVDVSLIPSSDWKVVSELYIGSFLREPKRLLERISLFSDYDWRQSRYRNKENAAFFDSVMAEGLTQPLKTLFSEEIAVGEDMPPYRYRAFSGALRSDNLQFELELRYVSFRLSRVLREQVTAAVKYTENKFRGITGIQSRLATTALRQEYKDMIDRALFPLTEKAQKERAEKKRDKSDGDARAYESLYDAKERGLDIAMAREIELDSRQNAALLIVDEDVEECFVTVEPVPVSEAADAVTWVQESVDEERLGDREIEYLKSLLNGGQAHCSLMEADVLAENINNFSMRILGDVALEMQNGSYTVIEDYLEEVSEWVR